VQHPTASVWPSSFVCSAPVLASQICAVPDLCRPVAALAVNVVTILNRRIPFKAARGHSGHHCARYSRVVAWSAPRHRAARSAAVVPYDVAALASPETSHAVASVS